MLCAPARTPVHIQCGVPVLGSCRIVLAAVRCCQHHCRTTLAAPARSLTPTERRSSAHAAHRCCSINSKAGPRRCVPRLRAMLHTVTALSHYCPAGHALPLPVSSFPDCRLTHTSILGTRQICRLRVRLALGLSGTGSSCQHPRLPSMQAFYRGSSTLHTCLPFHPSASKPFRLPQSNPCCAADQSLRMPKGSSVLHATICADCC